MTSSIKTLNVKSIHMCKKTMVSNQVEEIKAKFCNKNTNNHADTTLTKDGKALL